MSFRWFCHEAAHISSVASSVSQHGFSVCLIPNRILHVSKFVAKSLNMAHAVGTRPCLKMADRSFTLFDVSDHGNGREVCKMH